MSKQGDIRKFCLQGGGDSEEKDLIEFNPTASIINWLNSGKGTRHIKGHICTGPRGPKAAAPQSDADDWIV